MKLMLTVMAVLSVIEIVVWFIRPTLLSRSAGLAIALAVMLCSLSLLADELAIWTVIVAFLSSYRLINALRYLRGTSNLKFLIRRVRLTGYTLIGLQAAVVLIAENLHYPNLFWLYILAYSQLFIALLIFISTTRHHKTTKPPQYPQSLADKDLPTVSVAIPARNENQQLEACLQSLAASDYPKLEILVLDDCSQNRRTSEIIKAYAQSGIRFLAGKVPPESWLAKNYAYQQLTAAASGDYLLFCGVDVRLEPSSIRRMVESMLHKKKLMMSVMPENHRPPTGDFMELLVQPARYAWELALPRRLLQRPPVLSTCWMISADFLNDIGSFEGISRSISPESHLSKRAILHDGYTFIVSDNTLGVTSTKRFPEQKETALRVRYPQLHRRLELVALTSLAEFCFLLLPFAVLAAAVISQSWLIAFPAGLTCLLLLIHYAIISRMAYGKILVRSLLAFPFAAFYDIVLLHYSMWLYEFSQVIWKGRNVCLPVMRVEPHLPKS